MIFDTYYKSHPYTSLFGIFEPSHMLTQTGNSSPETMTNEHILKQELQNHGPPYENLEDAVHTFLDMRFWSHRLIGGYSPFVVVSASMPIRISKFEFTHKNITVLLNCPLETQLKALKVTLLDLHKHMTNFIREGNSNKVFSTLTLPPDNTITHCKLKLFYDGDCIEECQVTKS